MVNKRRPSAADTRSDLRHRAEARVVSERVSADAETQKLLHELQVHQIELELQNAELREARAEAEANLARYTDLYESAPMGYFTLDRAGVIQEMNTTGTRLLGRERSVLMGRRFSAFVTDDGLPALNDFLTQIFDNGTPQPLELALSPSAGTQLIAQIHAVIDAVGHTCNVAVADVTALKAADAVRAEQATLLSQQAVRLREEERRKDEFLAMLGHELRNPIAPILLAAEILEQQGVENEELVQWAIGMFKRQGEHLVRLVDELLDVARVTQGKIALSRTSVDLRDVMSHVLETGRMLVDEHKHVLSLSLPSDPVRVEADSVRLAQVLGNLLDNAVKFTPDGGRIGFCLEQEGDQAVIRVQDTGIGIAKPQLLRVFDLFTQAEPPLDRAQGGLGIGLALAKHLVELHGGSIGVSSAGVGQGSEFVVRLPLPARLPSADETPGYGAVRPTDTRRRRILVVDDQEDIVTAIALFLRAIGHEVHSATSGRGALELAGTVPLDVVLLDIAMPGLSGYEVASQLRLEPRLGHLKLIAMTGYGLDSDRQKSFNAGFDWHLVKPIVPGQLAALLAGLEETKASYEGNAPTEVSRS